MILAFAISSDFDGEKNSDGFESDDAKVKYHEEELEDNPNTQLEITDSLAISNLISVAVEAIAVMPGPVASKAVDQVLQDMMDRRNLCLGTFSGSMRLFLNFPQSGTWLSVIIHLSNWPGKYPGKAPRAVNTTVMHTDMTTKVSHPVFQLLSSFLKFPRKHNEAKPRNGKRFYSLIL
jgi:hypothetical protein